MPESGGQGETHYRTLDPALIIDTAERLLERDRRALSRSPGCARWPPSWCRCRATSATARTALAQPIWWLRVLTGAAIVAGAALFIFVGTILPFDRFSGGDASESVQGIEASINTLLLAGLGLLALFRAEQGIKRSACSASCMACAR